MRYGSVCSGVEAATLAWERLGWEAVFYAEVEPFPSAVLQQRFGATRPLRPLDPAEAENEKDRKMRISWAKQNSELSPVGRIPNLGDFTKIQSEDYDGKIDLLVGGTPCQDVSNAGKRMGFEGKRSVLALDFVRLCFESGTRWLCWENVPATLSSRNGEDFGRFLSLLAGWDIPIPKRWAKCGIVTPAPGCFGLAWRILDTQYTRVPEFPRAIPQRRKRLFLIGYLGDWRYPAKVLFDGEMRGGHTPPRRTKGQGVTADTQVGIDSAKWWNNNDSAGTLTCTSHNQFMPDKERMQCVIENGHSIFCESEPAATVRSSGGVNGGGSESLICLDMRQIEAGGGDISPTLISTDYKGGKAICFENHGQDSRIKEVEVSPVIAGKSGVGGGNLPLVQEVYSFDSLGSNSMKSANPDSGCRKVDVAKTIDTVNPEPSKNQGGMAVVEHSDVVAFIKNDAGGEQSGYWNNVFPTLRTQITPAVAFNVTFCDANGTRQDRKNGGLYISEAQTSKTITAGGVNAETVVIDDVIALDGDKMAKAERSGGSGLGINTDGVMYTQTVKDVHGVAYQEVIPLDLRNATRDPEKSDEMNRQGVGIGSNGDPMHTISASNVPRVGFDATVRRLLPVETERLMGFPDGHTQISWRGKPVEDCPDAPRYKACGNAFTVNCLLWLGHRIQAVENYIIAGGAL